MITKSFCFDGSATLPSFPPHSAPLAIAAELCRLRAPARPADQLSRGPGAKDVGVHSPLCFFGLREPLYQVPLTFSSLFFPKFSALY